MIRVSACAALFLTLAAPARGDEIQSNLEAALDAWRAGDLGETVELVDYVSTLLSAAKADSLAALLPAPLEGWTMEIVENEDAAALAMFGGGGSSASAEYMSADGARVSLSVQADSPMIAMFATQLANPALAAQIGDVRRISGETVVIGDDGLMALVAHRFLVQIDGDADAETLSAYFAAIDLDALKAF